MTIFNIARLPTASFKGVEFAYQDTSVDGGRKTISHEYPNRKERYVEDLGGIEKKFSITALTDNNVSFDDRDALIEVLESSGIGTLIHPTFGSQSVVCVGYNVSDNVKELGISKFTLNFEVASLNILPFKLNGNKGFLANLKSKILGKNEAVFDKEWKNVVKAKAKFDSAVKTTKQVANQINRASRLVQGAADSIGDATTALNQIVNSANSLVQSPSKLAANLRASFNNLSVGYNSAKDVFVVMSNLFGFDQRDRISNGNSQLQQDIKSNQDQLNNFVNAAAMAIAYNAAANIDYATLQDLNSVNLKLEAGFATLPSNLDKDIYQLILDMRVEATNIFSQLSISLPNIIDYEQINPISLNNLVYSFYGSLDLKENIRQLNQFGDTSRIQGNIKLLSNV